MPLKSKKQSKKQNKKPKLNSKTAKNKNKKNKKILTKKRRINLEKKINKKAHKDILDEIKKPKVVIVMFFAEWCPHCHNVRPHWNEMKEEIMLEYPEEFEIAEYEDIHKENGIQELKNKYLDKQEELFVQGYPTIGGIKNGKYIEFNGGRTKEGLLEFAHKLKTNYFSS
jgi:thiol-disulfide isomerase/thioredoxin